MDDFEPRELEELLGEEAIAAYAHPTRIRLLEVFGPRALTLTQAARELGAHPANFSRHLRILLGAGLLRLVGTRDTGRNLEKYYRASARSYAVSGNAPGGARIRGALGLLRESLAEAERASPDYALAYLLPLRLGERDRDELASRIASLVAEYGDRSDPGGAEYLLGMALYAGAFESPSDTEIRL